MAARRRRQARPQFHGPAEGPGDRLDERALSAVAFNTLLVTIPVAVVLLIVVLLLIDRRFPPKKPNA